MKKNQVKKYCRKTALFVQGHEYLFWSKGVYFLNILVKYYDIILVVPEEYGESKRFLEFVKRFNVKRLVYYCGSTYYKRGLFDHVVKCGWLTRHLSIHKLAKNIVISERPAIVVQNDYINIENLYFFNASNNLLQGCKRVVISVSNPSTKNTIDSFKLVKNQNAKRLATKFGLNFRLILLLIYIYRYWQSIIHNWILPFIITWEIPSYKLSPFRNVDVLCFKKVFDEFIVDDPIDIKYYSAILRQGEKVVCIKSVISGMYNPQEKCDANLSINAVAVFFSLTVGFRFDENLAEWAQVVKVLEVQGFEVICIKLHPSTDENTASKIKSYFNLISKRITIFTSQKSAEELIVSSKVIIGDVSSTLLWASAIGGKIVISINIKNDPNSGSMKGIDGILYFDSFNEAVKSMKNWKNIISGSKLVESKCGKNLKTFETYIRDHWLNR